MRTPLASLVVAGSLLTLALAPPAQAKSRYLRFEVVSVKGQQTANWTGTQDSGGCGTIHRSGSQTISFESSRPTRLRLRGFPRTNPRTGKRRRGFVYFGIGSVPANWTYTRTFQQSTPPSCPQQEEPIVAQAQASDCGTQGPFANPVTVGWRGGFVEFRGQMDLRPTKPRPKYRNCEYEALHENSLIDSKGRLPQRRLTSRSRRPIRVKVSERLKEPGEGQGSQTTVLEATVTLKRLR